MHARFSTLNSRPSTSLCLWRLGYAAVVLLSMLLYTGAVTYQPIWDDHSLISGEGIGGGHSLLRSFTYPFLGHYFRPFVSIAFFAQNRAFGANSAGHHVVSILLHGICTALLIAGVRSAFERRATSLLAGLLFAVQPVQSPVTTWIGAQTDAWSELWILLFALTLIRAARSDGGCRRTYLALSTAAWTLALLTKEQCIAALPLVPLAFTCFDKACPSEPAGQEHERAESRVLLPAARRPATWLATAPCLLAAVVFLATGWSLGMPHPRTLHPGLIPWLGSIGRTATYYTLLLLAPAPRWLHTLTLGRLEEMGVPPVLAGYAIIVGLALLYRQLLGRDRWSAWFLALAVLTLVPVSNLIPLPNLLVSPWRAGVSGLAIAALLARAFTWPRTEHQAPSAPRWRLAWVLFPLAAIMLCWSFVLTVADNTNYRDETTFYRAMVDYDPRCIVGQYQYANDLIRRGSERDAIPHLETILALLFGPVNWRDPDRAVRAIRSDPALRARIMQGQGSPDDPAIWTSSIYTQLGFTRLHTHDPAGAELAFLAARNMEPRDVFANTGLGICALQARDLPAAEQDLRRALAVQPDKPDAHAAMGYVFAARNQWKRTRTEFRAWIAGDPGSIPAYCALAEASLKLGDTRRAAAALRGALLLSPARDDIRARLRAIERSNG